MFDAGNAGTQAIRPASTPAGEESPAPSQLPSAPCLLRRRRQLRPKPATALRAGGRAGAPSHGQRAARGRPQPCHPRARAKTHPRHAGAPPRPAPVPPFAVPPRATPLPPAAGFRAAGPTRGGSLALLSRPNPARTAVAAGRGRLHDGGPDVSVRLPTAASLPFPPHCLLRGSHDGPPQDVRGLEWPRPRRRVGEWKYFLEGLGLGGVRERGVGRGAGGRPGSAWFASKAHAHSEGGSVGGGGGGCACFPA